MNDLGITEDEGITLRNWMRQGIAEAEMREVAAQFIKYDCDLTTGRHHSPAVKRRTARARQFSHIRELVN